MRIRRQGIMTFSAARAASKLARSLNGGRLRRLMRARGANSDTSASITPAERREFMGECPFVTGAPAEVQRQCGIKVIRRFPDADCGQCASRVLSFRGF